MPGLAAIHTIMVREHNRIARGLQRLNGGLQDEELFQRARRILIAEWQNIAYGEYLPLILGDRMMKRNGAILTDKLRSKYDPNMDPSARNSFATAAYRFGHSQIQGLILTMSGLFNSSYHLRDNFFSMRKYLEDDGAGLEHILEGLTVQKAAERDRLVTDEVTNSLFPGKFLAYTIAKKNYGKY